MAENRGLYCIYKKRELGGEHSGIYIHERHKIEIPKLCGK